MRAEGLRWLLIDCRQLDQDDATRLPRNCFPVRIAAGLAGIFATLRQVDRRKFDDWNDALSLDREWKRRAQIFRDLCDEQRSQDSQRRILTECANISPLLWERYCPPPQHPLANRIRAWLASAGTVPVTLWFENGEELLRKTTLTEE